MNPPIGSADDAQDRNKTFTMSEGVTPEPEEGEKKIKRHAFQPEEISELNVNYKPEKVSLFVHS